MDFIRVYTTIRSNPLFPALLKLNYYPIAPLIPILPRLVRMSWIEEMRSGSCWMFSVVSGGSHYRKTSKVSLPVLIHFWLHLLHQEYEIDKTLGIKGPEDVAKMGIAEYNKQCRGIVMRYSQDWEVKWRVTGGILRSQNVLYLLTSSPPLPPFTQISVTRLGRWIDFRNDYKTLYPWFMETVW